MYKLSIIVKTTSYSFSFSQKSYQYLPQARKLDKDTVVEVESLLKLNCNKKLLQNHVETKTGQKCTLRDLSNHNTKMLKKSPRHDLGSKTGSRRG